PGSADRRIRVRARLRVRLPVRLRPATLPGGQAQAQATRRPYGLLPPGRRTARHPVPGPGPCLMPALLEVENLGRLSRVPGGKRETVDLAAVGGLSFQVQTGGALAIVGESGSGKTTTARLIAGLESPTSGVIRVDGEARKPLPWARGERI